LISLVSREREYGPLISAPWSDWIAKSDARLSPSFRVARRLTAPMRLHPFVELDAPNDKWSQTHLKNLNGATYLGSQIRVMAISLQNYMQIFHNL